MAFGRAVSFSKALLQDGPFFCLVLSLRYQVQCSMLFNPTAQSWGRVMSTALRETFAADRSRSSSVGYSVVARARTLVHGSGEAMEGGGRMIDRQNRRVER